MVSYQSFTEEEKTPPLLIIQGEDIAYGSMNTLVLTLAYIFSTNRRKIKKDSFLPEGRYVSKMTWTLLLTLTVLNYHESCIDLEV